MCYYVFIGMVTLTVLSFIGYDVIRFIPTKVCLNHVHTSTAPATCNINLLSKLIPINSNR